MKKRGLMLVLFAVFVLVLCVPNTFAGEIFGGYSYARVDDFGNRVNLNGWNVSLAGKILPPVGIVFDFSGHYGSPAGRNSSLHTFLFGPRFTVPGNPTVKPFVHFLFGGARQKADVGRFSSVDTGFAMAIGGGADVKVLDPIRLRVLQVDYLQTRTFRDTRNNVRLSFGVVLHF